MPFTIGLRVNPGERYAAPGSQVFKSRLEDDQKALNALLQAFAGDGETMSSDRIVAASTI
jgi:hypothetical protein